VKWAKWRDVDRLVLLGVLAIKRSKLDKNKPVGVSRAPYIGLEVPNSGGEAGRPALYDSTQEKINTWPPYVLGSANRFNTEQGAWPLSLPLMYLRFFSG